MHLTLNNIKAVLFDMDGLLIDSERLALETFEEACAEHGATLNRDAYFKCIGTNGMKTRQIIIDGHDSNFPYEAITASWKKKYHRVTVDQTVPVKTGARQLLELFAGANVKMAVATSTPYTTAIAKLRSVKIEKYFELVVGGDQVEQSKPAPEIYLKAAAGLNVAAADCLVLEDSNNGVEAGIAAGMKVVQVPDLVQPSRVNGHPNFKIVRSLEEFSSELVGSY